MKKNTPKIRFMGFTDDWEQRKLGDVTERVRGNDGRMDLPTLTISAGSGWLDQRERFSNNIAGKEQKNYTLLHKGELSYNHGNSKLAKYGAVFELTNYEEALVPRVYHSFKTNEDSSSCFIEYMFATKKPDRELGKLVSSGARMDGLLNINFDEFMGINITLPSISEQGKISELLRKLDFTITLHQRKLEKLKQLKQAYLQQLFPNPGETVPKIRFANFEDEWEERKLEDIIISEMKGKAKAEMYGTVSPYLETNYLNGGEVSYVDSPKNVDEDDVIILWDGSQAGTVYHGFKGALGTTLKAYRPKESGKFLYQYLKLKQQVIYDSYRTPNIPHVIKTFTKEFNVHFTCYEEQNKIGIFLNKLDETTALYQSKIDKLKLMKKGFLQKMFI